jgi:hypothetical protein
MRTFQSPDGVRWSVGVKLPGASHAMLVFRHPNGRTSRLDRYAWINVNGPEAKNVTARVDPDEVLERLSESDFARYFRRSMRIAAADNPLGTPVTHAG